ncbi:MAG: methyltransferase [Vampirovibrio sp.]|nr:methyltransferase [Vampirovibrio sp.]
MSATISETPNPTANQGFQTLMPMITGYWVSACIYAAAKLQVADLLKNGPVAVGRLAEQCSVNEDYLYRVLRALAGLGIFHETADRQFEQTTLSNLLRADVEGSMHSIAVMMGEEHYHTWGRLLQSMQSGDQAFETLYGMPVFDYFEKNPEPSKTFNNAMTGFASNVHRAVVSAYDFSTFHTLVDVGGGHGALLTAILEKNPTLKAILFDVAHVVAGARIPQTLASRFETASGDFFQAVPTGGDAYILSTVIHDWSDELSLKILRNIHTAMPANGTLLLVEHVVEPDNQPSMGKLLDINMLLMTQGGRERSSAEYRELYRQAGFELTRIVPTPSGVCVIEGKKQ